MRFRILKRNQQIKEKKTINVVIDALFEMSTFEIKIMVLVIC